MQRILLIEDEEAVRRPLSEILRRASFEVVTAADGKEGMALFQQQAFGLVITDLIVPTQDGMETIIAVRRPYGSGSAPSSRPMVKRPRYSRTPRLGRRTIRQTIFFDRSCRSCFSWSLRNSSASALRSPARSFLIKSSTSGIVTSGCFLRI